MTTAPAAPEDVAETVKELRVPHGGVSRNAAADMIESLSTRCTALEGKNMELLVRERLACQHRDSAQAANIKLLGVKLALETVIAEHNKRCERESVTFGGMRCTDPLNYMIEVPK
jgi:hypothetical protein